MTSAVSVLPQPGGPHRSTRSLGRRPCACRTSSRVLLAEKLLDEGAVGGRQHDVLETPDRFAYRQQGKTTLAVLGDIARQLAHRRGRRRPRMSVENGLQIVREHMVLFLPLLGDHRLCRSAEGLHVAFSAGPDELSQQLAVGHGSFTT